MRSPGLIVAVGLAVGCFLTLSVLGQTPSAAPRKKSRKAPPAATVAEEPTPTPAAPVPAAPRPAPSPVARRFAPPGVLYVVQYTSVRVPGGVVGFEPGQRVKIVADKGDALVVSDGKYEAEINVESLTNDLDIAAAAARQDAAGQAQLHQMLAAYRAEAQKAEVAERDAQAKAVREVDAKRVAAGGVGGRDPFQLSPEDQRRNEDERYNAQFRNMRPRLYYVPRASR